MHAHEIRDFITLTRPLVWMDVETHDKVPPGKARIVELGLVILYPDGRESKKWQTFVDPSPDVISVGATEVHGITNADVVGQRSFAELADNLHQGMSNCDFGGYNVHFDLDVFAGEFARTQHQWSYDTARVVDPLRIWQVFRPRRLEDAVREWAGRDPLDSHRALADTQDAHDVFVGQLLKLEDLPRDLQKIHDLCFSDPGRIDRTGKFIWKEDVACIGFGKHNGTPMKSVPRDYFRWMAGADFPPDARKIAIAASEGKFPTRKPLFNE